VLLVADLPLPLRPEDGAALRPEDGAALRPEDGAALRLGVLSAALRLGVEASIATCLPTETNEKTQVRRLPERRKQQQRAAG
jgi:hypothetical protein